MTRPLQEAVLAANRRVVASGLVQLTWGNVSGLDPHRGVFYIKPSGVPYESLRAEDMVGVRLSDGEVVEGSLRPSSDTPTHRALYLAWASRGVLGICHTHSPKATAFAQAARALPCLGTTHADHFDGPVPVCRLLTPEEVASEYEARTGAAIVDCFRAHGLDPTTMPAVLQSGHAPFTWGATPDQAVDNAVALETCAAMALDSFSLRPDTPALPAHVLAKHQSRKHGPGAYYGQSGSIA
jgi:L-ribulose-5-phosphate 4-epimerase